MNNFFNTVKKIIESKDQPAKKVEKIKIAIDLVGDLGIPSQIPSQTTPEPLQATLGQKMGNQPSQRLMGNVKPLTDAQVKEVQERTAEMLGRTQQAALSSTLPTLPNGQPNFSASAGFEQFAKIKKGKK